MTESVYLVLKTKQFSKELNMLQKSGRLGKRGMQNFALAVSLLSEGQQLPKHFRDHQLKGEKKAYRECHILPDVLLVYIKNNKQLVLTLFRIGSHAKLLDK